MNRIRLHSEPFSRDGNLAADGASRLLGQPALSPLELVIRETLQNSWDASLNMEGTPIYTIRIRRLDPSQMDAIKAFFTELPPSEANEPISKLLGAFLNSSGLVMEICDAGTQGLDGPTSASRALNEGESANFVNFVRNIGSARDIALGGGTYGFGKSSLFKISHCKTVLIHTLFTGESGLTHRLIAKSLGSAFDHNGRRYTGRHWWGAEEEGTNGSVDPLVGDQAANLAHSLGLQERTSAEQRGTTLMILNPDLEELEEFRAKGIEPVAEIKNRLKARLQETILWHCWPKFTRKRDGSFPMECKLSVFGDEFSLPDPAGIQPLWLMTQALTKSRDRKDLIQCQRPKKLLGFFGEAEASLDMHADDRFRTYLGDSALIPEKLHHVALLRPAELVVRYVEGSINEADRKQWAGVFITDIGENGEVEQAFAMSEPPAHDDWQPKAAQSLTPNQRKYVQVALTRIRERVKKLSGSDLNRSNLVARENGSSLASLAGAIGRSLLGTGLGGADGRTRSSGGSGQRRRGPIKISTPVSIGTGITNGAPVATFKVRLTGEVGAQPIVAFTPWVQMDEGSKDPVAPNGQAPKVVSVESESQPLASVEKGFTCPIVGGGTVILVKISIPDYVAVGVTAEIIEGEKI